MTKNRFALIILVSLALGALYFMKGQENSGLSEIKPKINLEKLEIDGKKVVGLSPGKEKEEIKQIKVTNTTSETWKENLEKTLELQGGSSINEIKIEKVDSFIWSNDGVALHVESAVVKLKGENNVQTSFRVLVDAQTGKILRNWDQPVFDPVSPQDDFKLTARPVNDED